MESKSDRMRARGEKGTLHTHTFTACIYVKITQISTFGHFEFLSIFCKDILNIFSL